MAILEIWRTIAEAPYFVVSNHGRVKYLVSDEIMVEHVDGDYDDDLYLGVNLFDYQGTEFCAPIEALVVEAFLGPLDGLEKIDHIDGDPWNNFVWNLRVNDAYWNHYGCKADDCE